MKLLLEKFNFTINIEENKHTVIACEEQDIFTEMIMGVYQYIYDTNDSICLFDSENKTINYKQKYCFINSFHRVYHPFCFIYGLPLFNMLRKWTLPRHYRPFEVCPQVCYMLDTLCCTDCRWNELNLIHDRFHVRLPHHD